jgi:hypothetical protein
MMDGVEMTEQPEGEGEQFTPSQYYFHKRYYLKFKLSIALRACTTVIVRGYADLL